LKANDIYHQRFFDAASSGGLAVGRPADYWVWHNNRLVFIECKETKGKSLPFSKIRPSQFKAAKLAAKYGYYYYFLIYIGNNHYLISGNDILEYVSDTKRKSISFSKIFQLGILVDKNSIAKILEHL
jgi:penicillin-binding protein-related factor A (putative recombinase)